MSPIRIRITSPGTSSRDGGVTTPVPPHPALDRQLSLQRIDGLARLMLLPEPDRGVGHQQQQDDAEIRPVPQHPDKITAPRSSTGWTPEIGQQLQDGLLLFLLNLVRPYLATARSPQPGSGLRRRTQPLCTSSTGRDFRSSFASGTGPAPDPGAPGRPAPASLTVLMVLPDCGSAVARWHLAVVAIPVRRRWQAAARHLLQAAARSALAAGTASASCGAGEPGGGMIEKKAAPAGFPAPSTVAGGSQTLIRSFLA